MQTTCEYGYFESPYRWMAGNVGDHETEVSEAHGLPHIPQHTLLIRLQRGALSTFLS